MGADPVPPVTDNEREMQSVREALAMYDPAHGGHDLTAGETDIDAEHSPDCRRCKAEAAVARLVAALSAAGEDARKRDEWECHIAAMNSELATKLDAAEAALSAAITERDEALAQVGAATTILAEAEKIVPGIITTAGRFAIGLNDRERALAAEGRAVAAEQALGEIAYLVMTRRIGIHMNGEEQWPTPMHKQIADLARAALAAAAAATTLNEPERWPCGCVKGETPHGAGWADCESAAAGAEPNEAEQGE